MQIFVVIVSLTLLVQCTNSAAIQDEPATYITNGEDQTEILPFYGYLEISRNNVFYFGGSALISRRSAITVAQNVVGFSSWRVGVGGTRIPELIYFTVSEAISHPDYQPLSLTNNIAVLILTQTIWSTPNIAPIAIPPLGISFPVEQTIGSVVGFGFGSANKQPEVLQTTTFRVMGQQECGNFYPHLVQTNQLQNNFCAHDPNELSNICSGDQGGPIYSQELNVMFGIASFIRSDDCNSPDSGPAVFVRLSEYFNWLAPHL